MRPLLMLTCLFAATSCTTVRDNFRLKGLARASFDLNCPAEQIDYVVLNRPTDERDGLHALGTQVGVTGCNQRTVYVLSGHPKQRWSWSWLSNREVSLY